MEDVPLMEMDGDQSLKHATLDLGELLCGDVDEHVKHLQEYLVCAVHDLLVRLDIVESYFSIPGP